MSAFARLPIDRTHVYYWPLESRERNQAGKPGKLHAKCAIIVDTAVIGSANMTDDAFNRNIEMGVIVREQSTVADLVERFDELVRRRILVSYMPVRNESSALARPLMFYMDPVTLKRKPCYNAELFTRLSAPL